jgi:hypothetical protein
VAARSRQVLSGAQSQMDAAVDRVAAFISYQQAIAVSSCARRALT